MKLGEVGMLFALAAIWGASYLFIRVASPALGPLPLMEARVLLAGAILYAYAHAVGRQPDLRGQWRRYLVLGTVAGAAPFSLIAAAELYLPASLAAILNATTPLFTAVVAGIWLRERFTPARGVGMLLGIVGVLVLMGWSTLSLTGGVVFGVVASLGGALCYAIGGTFAGRAFAGVPPLAIASGQQIGAAVVLLPFALATLPRAHPTPAAIANMLALALISTAVAYLIYYPLLKRVGPTRTLSVTFLIPVFGVLWGVLFLQERIDLGTVIGLAIILSSVTLVTGVRFRPTRGTVHHRDTETQRVHGEIERIRTR